MTAVEEIACLFLPFRGNTESIRCTFLHLKCSIPGLLSSAVHTPPLCTSTLLKLSLFLCFLSMTFLPFLVPASRRFFSSASSGKREDLLSGPVFSWRPSFSPLSFSLPPYSAHTFPDPFAAPKGGHLAVQPRPSRMVGRDSSKQLRDALLQPSTLPV